MNYTTTTLSIAIHPAGENPVFSDGATHVSVEDDGGGAFLIVRQHLDDPKPGEIRVDPAELDQILEAGRQLLSQASLRT